MEAVTERSKGGSLFLENISNKGLSPTLTRINMLDESRNCSASQATSCGHSRSKSASDNNGDSTNWEISVSKAGKPGREELGRPLHPDANARGRHTSSSDRRAALEQDVEQLQMRLQHERSMRHTLERAMGRASSALSPGHHHFASQTRDLITEIAMLEEEVNDREQHVLSLYRSVFDQCRAGSPSKQYLNKVSPSHVKYEGKRLSATISRAICTSNKFPPPQHRRHVSVSTQDSQNANMQLQSKSRHASLSSSTFSMDERIQSLHSQTASRLQYTRLPSSERIVKDIVPDSESFEQGCEEFPLTNEKNALPRTLKDYIHESPNRLSEELLRCMAAIYCKLSYPPFVQSGMELSPSSSLSSSSIFSPRDAVGDGWSPRWKRQSVCEPLKNPFKIKGEAVNAGPYNSMVEVPWICADKDQLADATCMLRTFRSIVGHLESIDPSQMQRDSKLAFWINVYNALVMHAYLAYGIPRSNLRRMLLFQRAAYKIGGHSINANTIEHSILCCRTYRPTPWIETLLSTGARFKAGEERRMFGRMFGLDVTEPLVCFALCNGGYSDPAVRIYTAKNVHDELESAKREFLQASIGIEDHRKIFLPKILERYMKEASINSANLLTWVSDNVDKQLQDAIKKCIERKPHKKSAQCIDWLQYNGSFRYIFARDLALRLA